MWQNLTLERYREAVSIPLQPVMIQQESPLDDGLAREWDPPNLGVDKHYGYAFQWLALAVDNTRVLSRDPCQTPLPGRNSLACG